MANLSTSLFKLEEAIDVVVGTIESHGAYRITKIERSISGDNSYCIGIPTTKKKF